MQGSSAFSPLRSPSLFSFLSIQSYSIKVLSVFSYVRSHSLLPSDGHLHASREHTAITEFLVPTLRRLSTVHYLALRIQFHVPCYSIVYPLVRNIVYTSFYLFRFTFIL